MNNRYRCSSGRHYFNSEEKADKCSLCRRSLDGKVRRFFKRMSDEMLALVEEQGQSQKRRGK